MPSIPPFLCLFCLLSLLFCNYFCLQSRLFCGYFAFYPTFSVAIFASYASFSVFYFSSVSPIFHLLSLLYPTFCPSYILVFSHLVSNDIFASIVLPFSVIVLSSVVFVYTSIPLWLFIFLYRLYLCLPVPFHLSFPVIFGLLTIMFPNICTIYSPVSGANLAKFSLHFSE